MRIGVVANLDRSAGGVYQYAVTMLEALPDLATDDEFVLFTYVGDTVPEPLAATWSPVELRRFTGLLGVLGRLRSALAPRDGVVDPEWRRFFRRHGIDLLVFTADVDLAYRTGVPYIVAIHDIQHRLHPEFPEVSADGEWERREARLRPLIEHAAVVLVDSEVGAEDILQHYGDTGIAADAVRPLPFLPAHYLERTVSDSDRRRMRDEFGIEGPYLFYPAQFWPHKNHVRLVEALGSLARRGVEIPLVLVGSADGELRSERFEEVMRTAREQGVETLVIHLGYVPDEMMSALYAEATALVMPTFFGPTNIPVLEAFQLGCPVITSDMRGIREQVGDAAVLVDPQSSESIAQGIERVVTDESLRATLIARGHATLDTYDRAEYLRLLREAIERAKREVGADR